MSFFSMEDDMGDYLVQKKKCNRQGTKKRIEISESYFKKLQQLAKHYYVVEGEKAMPLGEAVQHMIDSEYRDYNPPEYQTTGFDRQ